MKMKPKCILPNQKWLLNNGVIGLAQCIRKYPEKFAHIKQEKMLKTTEEHVRIAENLARKNNNILQNIFWLNKNGYRDLSAIISKYPEKFAHIKQSKKYKTIEEQVKIAEDLAKSNKGFLPSSGWLQKNGYNGLSQMIYKYPKRFSHIKQEKLIKTIDEAINEAEELAKKNNNILQNPWWLITNGYRYLYKFIRKYPERFSHIKQIKLRKAI